MEDSRELQLMSSSSFEELSTALASASSGTHERPANETCCCGRGGCIWREERAELQTRLVLAARVGQAILEKHELYVRNHSKDADVDEMHNKILELQKSLELAHQDLERSEAQHALLLSSYSSAESTIARLTTSVAHTSSLQSRVSILEEECEDLKTELGVERKRADSAEGRYERLRSESERLKTELESMREREKQYKMDNAIRVTRAATLPVVPQTTHNSPSSLATEELTSYISNLISENDSLKRQNTESDVLLASLRDEIMELRLKEHEQTRRNGSPPHSRTPSHTPSAASLSLGWHRHHTPSPSPTPPSPNPDADPGKIQPFSSPHRKTPSPPHSRRASHTPSAASLSLGWHRQHAPSPINLARNLDVENSSTPVHPSPHRTLFLLSRECGVQTDPIPEEPSQPSLRLPDLARALKSSTSEDTSDTSSTMPLSARHVDQHADNTKSNPSKSESEQEKLGGTTLGATIGTGKDGSTTLLTVLLTHTASLLRRLSSTDIPSISSRLKRQNLLLPNSSGLQTGSGGATTSTALHISRNTIASILNEFAALRGQMRNVIAEQESMRRSKLGDGAGVDLVEIVVYPAEFRELLNLFRLFMKEIGALRGKINEWELGIQAPTPPVSAGAGGGASNWLPSQLAPLTKLLAPTPTPLRSAHHHHSHHHHHAEKEDDIHRVGTPALPVLASTTATAFGATGIETSTSMAPPQPAASQGPAHPQVRGIFAGARKDKERNDKEWVVLKKSSSRVFSTSSMGKEKDKATTRKNEGPETRARKHSVLVEEDEDEEESELIPTRTLRKGHTLSDSSIHASFIGAGGITSSPISAAASALPVGRQEGWWKTKFTGGWGGVGAAGWHVTSSNRETRAQSPSPARVGTAATAEDVSPVRSSTLAPSVGSSGSPRKSSKLKEWEGEGLIKRGRGEIGRDI